MESAKTVSRVLPFSSKHGIEAAFRRSFLQHVKAPTLRGLSQFLEDIGTARIVCPSVEGLRDLQDAATWELAILTQELASEDRDIAAYEDVMSGRIA